MTDVIYYPDPIPAGVRCANCGEPRAVGWWTGDGDAFAALHGQAVPWCRLCILSAQLRHAEQAAARVPELRRAVIEEEAKR